MMKSIFNYFKRISPSERVVWLTCIVSIIFIIQIATGKKSITISSNSVISLGEYDLKDRVDIYNIDSVEALFELDTCQMVISLNLNEEQIIYGYFQGIGDGTLEAQYAPKIPSRKTDFYFYHCTATKEGVSLNGEWFSRFFKDENGWARPGYSFIILPDGSIDTLQEFVLDGYTDLDEFTYGVKGLNLNSMSFAYVGGVDKNLKPKDTQTKEQIITAARVFQEIYCIDPNANILGHKDSPTKPNKACPSHNVKKLYKLN